MENSNSTRTRSINHHNSSISKNGCSFHCHKTISISPLRCFLMEFDVPINPDSVFSIKKGLIAETQCYLVLKRNLYETFILVKIYNIRHSASPDTTTLRTPSMGGTGMDFQSRTTRMHKRHTYKLQVQSNYNLHNLPISHRLLGNI